MEQNNKNTALLVMDMQAGIIGMLPNAIDLLPKVAQAIASARENKIPVIYVTVGFRQGAPEVSMNNKGVAAVKGSIPGLHALYEQGLGDLPPANEFISQRGSRAGPFVRKAEIRMAMIRR